MSYSFSFYTIKVKNGVQHMRTHTHTHTHTHTQSLWGLSIDIMVFIVYKMYILPHYINPTSKPKTHFQKHDLDKILKR